MTEDGKGRGKSRVLVAVMLIGLLVIAARIAWRRLANPHLTRAAAASAPANVAQYHRAVTTHQDSSPPTPPPKSASMEVCGHGLVPVDPTDPGGMRAVGALTQETASRWLTALQNSDDLRARLAGLVLEGRLTAGGPLSPVAEDARNEAVQLASGTSDPAAYAMALSLCQGISVTDTQSACPRLSLQQWANRDPDNAVPWLRLAAQARSNKDAAAEADAFGRAAQAHRIDSYDFSVLTYAESEMPPDAAPLDRSYLAIEVIGIEAASGLTGYGGASQHCARAMQDDRVRRQCDSLAHLLVDHGTNLLDLAVGTVVGKRAGWPQARIDELSRELHALLQALRQADPDPPKAWSCDAVVRTDRYLSEVNRLGELAAAREMVERSGESVESLARRYDEWLEALRRANQTEEISQQASP